MDVTLEMAIRESPPVHIRKPLLLSGNGDIKKRLYGVVCSLKIRAVRTHELGSAFALGGGTCAGEWLSSELPHTTLLPHL